MLYVKTFLAASATHGIGLFADEDIPAGSAVWMFNTFTDQILSRKKLGLLSKSLGAHGLTHMMSSIYKRNGRYFYVTDNARFINHADEGWNVDLIDDFTEIAVRDIRRGEEIFENYFRAYDPDDFFVLEMKNIGLREYFQMPPRQRRRVACR